MIYKDCELRELMENSNELNFGTRFKEGDRVMITSGPHKGKMGTIVGPALPGQEGGTLRGRPVEE